MKSLIDSVALAKSFNDSIFLSKGNYLFLKSDGRIGCFRPEPNDPRPYSPLDNFTIKLLEWENIKKLAIIPQYYNRGGLHVGLTFDDQLLVEDPSNEYSGIREWTGIVELKSVHFDKRDCIIGLSKDGSVYSCPEIHELSNWYNVKEIYVQKGNGSNDFILGITNDGKVLYCDTIKNYEKKAIDTWEDIIEVCKVGDPYNKIYGLTQKGELKAASFEPEHLNYPKLISIHNEFAITETGYAIPMRTRDYEHFMRLQFHKTFGDGYIQVSSWFSPCFLNIDGRVDWIGNYSNRSYARHDIERECYSDLISISPFFIDKDGYCLMGKSSGLKKSRQFRLFVGDPHDYRKKKSETFDDNTTKEAFVESIEYHIRELEREQRNAGFFQKRKYRDKIQNLEDQINNCSL